MTVTQADPAFFAQHLFALGALAWPNVFDLMAKSLRHGLESAGQMRRDAEAA